MPLVTVFFSGEGDVLYRKAIIDADHVDFFLALGAVRMAQDLKEKKPKAVPAQETKVSKTAAEKPKGPDPDKGWGKPGSMRWHNSYIQSTESIDDLYNYVLKVTGEKIYRRGNLFNLQRNAMKRVKAYFKKHPKKLVKNDS